MDLTDLIKNVGLSDKAARVYLASLELGEATVQDLAKRSRLKRTTVYYVLGELSDFGAILAARRGKKQYYLPEEPRILLKRSRERLADFEDSLALLEERKHAVHERPRVYFLYGPAGFKQAWDMVFARSREEFLIMTAGEHFLDFVKEKYILDEIIKNKRTYGISSRQLITDSPYARMIVGKDSRENRTSKILSNRYPLSFTEIISQEFVVFISPRPDNLIMVMENDAFAKTRCSAFELLWNAVPVVPLKK